MTNSRDNVIDLPVSKVEDTTDEPTMYRVVLYNDDFTPKAFVVEVLVTIFHKGAAEATELMWRVHSGKRGVAGVYPRDVAETKVKTATALAREEGFPLKVVMEPDR